jgi:hypothetical protein
MNKRAWIVMWVVAVQAAGCVIETTHRDGGGVNDDGGGSDVATVSARWSLRNALDGSTTRCPSGFDTVELIALPIDDAGNATAEPTIDLFDCNQRSGGSTGLFPDLYQVWIEVRSHDLTALYAQSLSQILDVRRADQVFTTDILNDGGYFQLAWDLVGKSTNRPVHCADAGLTTIHLVSVAIADSQRAYEDPLACEDGRAVTAGLLQGSYMIAIDALSADVSVGHAEMLTSKPIAGQNAITDLGLVVIPIDGL